MLYFTDWKWAPGVFVKNYRRSIQLQDLWLQLPETLHPHGSFGNGDICKRIANRNYSKLQNLLEDCDDHSVDCSLETVFSICKNVIFVKPCFWRTLLYTTANTFVQSIFSTEDSIEIRFMFVNMRKLTIKSQRNSAKLTILHVRERSKVPRKLSKRLTSIYREEYLRWWNSFGEVNSYSQINFMFKVFPVYFLFILISTTFRYP